MNFNIQKNQKYLNFWELSTYKSVIQETKPEILLPEYLLLIPKEIVDWKLDRSNTAVIFV